MSRDTHQQLQRTYRWRQTLAAWKVLWTRPLAIFMLLSLVPVLVSILSFSSDRRVAPDNRTKSNWPSHRSWGNAIHRGDEFLQLSRTGESDESITGINFNTLGSIHPIHDRDLLMVFDRPPNTSRGTMREIPLTDAERIVGQLPNLRWVGLHAKQLRDRQFEELHSLTALTTIETADFDIQSAELAAIANINTLENLKLEALWSDADLSVLKVLPNLKFLHLCNGRKSSPSMGKLPLLSASRLKQIAQLPHLQALVLESNPLFAASTLNSDELTRQQSESVSEIADILATMPSLQTVYVGYQTSGADREALRILAETLPDVSVRPAWYSLRPMFSTGILMITGIFGVLPFVLHLVSCYTLPLSRLYPGAGVSHARMSGYAFLVFGLLHLVYFGLCTEVATLSAAALILLVPVAFLFCVCLPFVGMATTQTPWRRHTLIVLLGFQPMILMIPSFYFVAQIEWFLRGEQPVAAALIVVGALCAGAFAIRRLQSLQRTCTEASLAPAASLQDLAESFRSYQGRAIKSPQPQLPTADWLSRLEQVLHRGQQLWFKQLKLWSMGMFPERLFALLRRRTPLFLLMCHWPIAVQYYEGIPLHEALPVVAMPTTALAMYIVIFVVGTNLYGRFHMFGFEVLRPVKRKQWSHTVFVTTMSILTGGLLWIWLIVQLSIMLIEQRIALSSLAMSFTAVVCYSGLAGGLTIFMTVKRRLIYTLAGFPLIFFGILPVIVFMAEDRSPVGLLAGYLDPTIWIAFVATEGALAVVLLLWAWRSWPAMELG